MQAHINSFLPSSLSFILSGQIKYHYQAMPCDSTSEVEVLKALQTTMFGHKKNQFVRKWLATGTNGKWMNPLYPSRRFCNAITTRGHGHVSRYQPALEVVQVDQNLPDH
jgi:hypothetical protein